MRDKIVAMALVVFMIFSLASCKKDKEKETEGDGLTIEVEKIEYDSEYVSWATQEVRSLASEFVDALGYSEQMDEDDLDKIAERFREDIVPILIDVKIYPSEFTSLMECTRECIALEEDSNSGGDGPDIIANMYAKFASILEADRAGALAYEIHLLAIDIEREEAQKNYDKHGYPYLLDDVNYYTGLIGRAKALGRDSFADAFSVIAFGASLVNSSASFDSDGVDISVADTLDILKKQGEQFASLTLSGNDWQTIAEMCEVFMPRTGSSIEVALNGDDFFIEAADVMPDILTFYAELTSDISREIIHLIENGEKYAIEIAVCRELMKNEAAFETFLIAFEDKFPSEGENSLVSVKLNDKESYEAFCNTYSADREELISAIKTFLNDSNDLNYTSLKNAYIGYFANINSVIAYSYIGG